MDFENDFMNIGEQPLINHDRRPHGKKHQAFLNDLITHRNQLKEFYRIRTKEEANENESASKQNRKLIKSFLDWKRYNTEEKQNELVNEIINTITDSPTNWRVNFEPLNNYGKQRLNNDLVHILQNVVAPRINADDKYFFNYKVSDDKGYNWVKVPLRADTFQELINRLKDGGLIFDIDNRPPEYFYEQGHPELPYWSLFSEISLYKNTYESKVNNDRGGSFFGYWNKTFIDLRRYQIFAREDNYFERRACIEVPCVIWSLRDLIPDDKLNAVALRLMTKNPRGMDEIITNYHNNKDLDFICREQHIHCKVHYYDEDCEKPQFRILDRGVDESKAKYHVELALYKQHYFKFEMTQYTRYFIKNIEELKWVDNGNKVVSKRNTGTYKRDSREKYYLNSLELLIEMMKNDMFSKMNFQDLYALTLKINPDTPLTEVPLFEDCQEFHYTHNGYEITDTFDTKPEGIIIDAEGNQLWPLSDDDDIPYEYEIDLEYDDDF